MEENKKIDDAGADSAGTSLVVAIPDSATSIESGKVQRTKRYHIGSDS